MSLSLAAPRWTACPGPGDSIAVDGCCLTIVEARESGKDELELHFQVVPQTLQMTTLGALQEGQAVNLETAATTETLLGGHLVQGHVDGVGQVISNRSQDGDVRIRIQPPAEILELIVPQGSITVAGVSLTVAGVTDGTFDVALVPTTLEETTLGSLVEGDRVNLESDILLRSMRHLMEARGLLTPR